MTNGPTDGPARPPAQATPSAPAEGSELPRRRRPVTLVFQYPRRAPGLFPTMDAPPTPPPVPRMRAATPPAPARRPPARRPRNDTRPPRRSPARTRRPAAGLLGLLLFTLVASFFGWVSAEPAALALGRGTSGRATVTACHGQGLGRACTVDVRAPGTEASGLRLAGADALAGQRVPVRLVRRSARVAYAGPQGTLVVRALVGLLLVLACGAGTVWATGAARLAGPARLLAVPASAAVPLLLALGPLLAVW